ncbi:ABC transporter permease [Paenibacillus sp. PR3]|uniref:ABC transporter permease n=1 Tax=Paenibacillus terricola TaxID=2763503 RepID=A0ABR8N2D6_9BACL|nr:ABC transporter permease [Paenibacillus terricola]MBD3922316.1 ABC transporter permease [Paenibacillus terricola]
MLSILRCEIIKLRRLHLEWIIAGSALFTGFLELSAILYQKRNHGTLFSWDWLMFTNFRYVSYLIIPIVVSLLVGFLIAREYQDNTANVIFTYRYPRNWFLIGKYLVIIPLLFILILLEFAATIGAGLLLPGHPSLTLAMIEHYMRIYGLLFLMVLCFVPAAALISIIFKSYIASTIYGLIVLISGAITINSPTIGLWYPWAAPIVIISSYFPNNPNATPALDDWKGMISLLLLFVVPLLINFRLYRRIDIANT